ncbi:iron-containing alcohol dehydrogenase [Oceanibium sediminis]|uniref:iron-containing alcohol dehydrogenase n=1 Tax=Oceanibium sediminis TaxID=2026339 RepID=UPI000DD3113B|nr:iron-containing alcohol dehydrogenase [Oceanibium sediminis]
MTPAFAFNTTPGLRFGSGAAPAAAEELAARLGPRILVVTDAGLRAAGVPTPTLEALGRLATLVIFDAVEADPSRDTLMAAVAAGRDGSVTGILGIGGGSPMDVAKLSALLLGSGEDLDTAWGVGQARGPRLPLALVPTTAGTGSEVTPVSIITLGGEEKRGVVSPVILPDIAVLDPDLTLGLPPAATAATGIDAMVHAIEGYTSRSPNNNPISRMLAVEALKTLGANIERAVQDGSDTAARAGMLLGAMLAGQAFANSPVAAVHALAYPLGGTFHIPHGLSNALVLGPVMRFNAPEAARAYADLAPHVFPDIGGGGSQDRAQRFIDALGDLSARLGLPPRLRDVNIPKEALPKMAKAAMLQTRLLVNNPREVAQADALAIYEAAW